MITSIMLYASYGSGLLCYRLRQYSLLAVCWFALGNMATSTEGGGCWVNLLSNGLYLEVG